MKQEVRYKQPQKQPQPQKQKRLGKGKERRRLYAALDGLSRAMHSSASRVLDIIVVVIDGMTKLLVLSAQYYLN